MTNTAAARQIRTNDTDRAVLFPPDIDTIQTGKRTAVYYASGVLRIGGTGRALSARLTATTGSALAPCLTHFDILTP